AGGPHRAHDPRSEGLRTALGDPVALQRSRVRGGASRRVPARVRARFGRHRVHLGRPELIRGCGSHASKRPPPRQEEMSMRQLRPVHVALVAALLVTIVTGGPGTIRDGAAQGPITISIVDVSGDLSSTRPIIDNYQKANPQKVKAVNIQRAPPPELPAKIKPQQDAGRVDVNLLLIGQDAGSVMAANGQLVKLFPQYDKLFPAAELTDAGKVLETEGEGFLLPSVVSNGGPVFIYNPAKVKQPPKTVDEFKAWVKAKPD